MVSKRNFFAIILMMAVVFFLCQFSQVIRSHQNQNNNDLYDGIPMPSRADEWNEDSFFSPDIVGEENIGESAERNIIIIGSPDSEAEVTVKQWCKLIKAPLCVTSNFRTSLVWLVSTSKVLLI